MSQASLKSLSLRIIKEDCTMRLREKQTSGKIRKIDIDLGGTPLQ